MPNGFGFNWPGHSAAPGYRVLGGIPIGSGGAGLFNAAEAAVGKLALAGGVKLPSVAPSAGGSAAPSSAGASAAGQPAQKSGVDDLVGIIALALVAIAVVALSVRVLVRRRGWSRPRLSPGPRLRLPAGRLRLATAGTVLLVALGITLVILARSNSAGTSQADALATNPDLDPGTPVSGVAPDFSLADQFGQPVSLHSFRGKVIILAFNDSECTTVCPLTTTAMLDAKAMLGKAGSQVQLLGVDADPAAISLEDVWSYSELHGMLHSWQFLTGSLPQLQQVWKDYGIEAAVQAGEITHTPALFVIGPGGPALAPLHDPDVLHRGPTAGSAAGRECGGVAAEPSIGACRSVIRPGPANPAKPAGNAASRGRRDRRGRPRKRREAIRVLRHVGSGDQRPRRPA